jgi:hypothetical protein
MIDFTNPSYVKLTPVHEGVAEELVGPLLVDGEIIFAGFKGVRDTVVFTTHRIIAVNLQGLTGKKRDYTSLPYKKITAFSFETAGTFDRDAEMEVYLSGLGKVRFEFGRGFDVPAFSAMIAQYIL